MKDTDLEDEALISDRELVVEGEVVVLWYLSYFILVIVIEEDEFFTVRFTVTSRSSMAPGFGVCVESGFWLVV